MSWINELIGFFIILFVFFFPLLKKILLKKSEKQATPAKPPSMEDEGEEGPSGSQLDILLKTEKKVSQEAKEFHSELEERHFDTFLSKRKLETKLTFDKDVLHSNTPFENPPKANRLNRLLERKKGKAAMIIFSEMMKGPKA